MRAIQKLKNKKQQITIDWHSDIYFSKEYAKLRRKDTIFSTLRIRKLSDLAFRKREEYIIRYLSKSIKGVITKYQDKRLSGKHVDNAPIWICWWTGLETAPSIVKQCVKSIYKRANNHPVYLITEKNYQEHIQIPAIVLKKLKSAQMGVAHFCDYLRVALLEKYGGLWLDATIYCSQPVPDWCFDLPFFTLKSPYTESRYISKYQWVTFCLGGWKGNQFYSFLKEAFEEYWSKNDYAIDYLFFDYLIYVARESCPFIKKMMDDVPENTPHRDDLQAAMNAALPAEQFWQVIREDTELYKLSWRETYSEKTADGQQSVYGYFLNMEL